MIRTVTPSPSAALDDEYGGVATVGVAMGAAGTDTAVESADVALMSDDLLKLPYLYALSGKANGVIRENIRANIDVKALLAVEVPFGLVERRSRRRGRRYGGEPRRDDERVAAVANQTRAISLTLVELPRELVMIAI